MTTNLPTTAEPAQNGVGTVENDALDPSAGPHLSRAQGEASAREETLIPESVREVREMLAEDPGVECPPITSASVRVMRSHDYCHFEVTLSSNDEMAANGTLRQLEDLTPERVDALRKTAARLVDKAVAQFKVAKRAAERLSEMEQKWRYEQALRLPEDERSPEAKAIIKFHDDRAFARRFEYDYEDDWQEPGED